MRSLQGPVPQARQRPDPHERVLQLFELSQCDEASCDTYNAEQANGVVRLQREHADQDPVDHAKRVLQRLARPCRTLAVQAQGPAQVRAAALGQQEHAEWALAFLREIQPPARLERVLCTGRPGLEIGFAAAARSLGLAVELTMPKHFAQRGISGLLVPRLPWRLQEEIEHYAKLLALA